MLFLKKSLFLCLFLGCLITLQAVEDKDSLRHFARKVVNGNRTLIAEGHDLTDALISKRKALEVFSPSLTLSADSGNSVNRSYNSATGFDEDYKTENVDFGAEISHRTTLGRLNYGYLSGKTDYTTSKTSYFNSLYMSWRTGLLRRDDQIGLLDKKLAYTDYEINEAQADAVLLDVLISSYQNLFNLIIATENKKLKDRNRNFYATLVEEAEIKLKNGLGSELDLKQAKMRQRQAETGLFEIERSINGYERQIAAKLGDLTWDKEIVNFTFEDVLSEVPNTIDSNRLIKTAFEMRPDFRVIERQYLRQKSLLEKARLLRRPDLSALAKWGKQGRGFSENEAKEMNDKSWSVGLVYNISFGPEPSNLDFYSQKEKLLAFEARIAQKRDEVIIAVNESQERLEFYKKNLELLRASEKLASEVLDGQKLNFQLGKISLLDLTVYQQDYDNAGISLIQGEARLIQEWLTLLYETGELSRYLDVGTGKDFVRRQNTIIVAEENE